MTSLFDLIRKRRSIRKYKAQPVEKSKVDTILKAALMSPASKRSNPWSFIVVDDKELLTKLSSSKPHGASFLKDAPLAIVVCADKTKSDVWVEDTSIASIIIQMVAMELGLGSCWIQIRLRDHESGILAEEFVKQALSLPANMSVESIISIGYPDEEKLPFDESKLLKDRVMYNRYIAKWELND